MPSHKTEGDMGDAQDPTNNEWIEEDIQQFHANGWLWDVVEGEEPNPRPAG